MNYIRQSATMVLVLCSNRYEWFCFFYGKASNDSSRFGQGGSK